MYYVIERVAEAVQHTTENSLYIRQAMEQMSTMIETVYEMGNEQAAIAGHLKGIVNNFKV